MPQHFFDDAQTCGTFVIHGALAPCSIDSDVGATVVALKHSQTVNQDKSHGSVEKRCWQHSETTKIESEWQEQTKKCYHNESILLSEQKKCYHNESILLSEHFTSQTTHMFKTAAVP